MNDEIRKQCLLNIIVYIKEKLNIKISNQEIKSKFSNKIKITNDSQRISDYFYIYNKFYLDRLNSQEIQILSKFNLDNIDFQNILKKIIEHPKKMNYIVCFDNMDALLENAVEKDTLVLIVDVKMDYNLDAIDFIKENNYLKNYLKSLEEKFSQKLSIPVKIIVKRIEI